MTYPLFVTFVENIRELLTILFIHSKLLFSSFLHEKVERIVLNILHFVNYIYFVKSYSWRIYVNKTD